MHVRHVKIVMTHGPLSRTGHRTRRFLPCLVFSAPCLCCGSCPSPTSHACTIVVIVIIPIREQGQSLRTRGRLLLAGKSGDMLRLLSLRRIRPWASTSPSTYLYGTGTMAKSSAATPNTVTSTSPTKVGVYAGGIEMPFTSTLRIVDPDKLPVSSLTQQ